MFNPFRFFVMPEYFFNPRQALRRFRRLCHRQQPTERMRLPWGALVIAHTGENIGRALYYYGIFDKVVPEAIFRLLDHGEVGVEIGANIGQNCSCMAYRAGPQGRVLAFEPHPEILSELHGNIALWPKNRFAQVSVEPVALSAAAGEAFLDSGAEFQTNRGSAAISTASNPARGFMVRLARLDDYLRDVKQVGFCKIDVEGHELNVLRGATELLKRRALRDIVFEDYEPQPSPVATLLRQHGYEIFKLGEDWLRPTLLDPCAPASTNRPDTHNFLATLEPARVRARYRAPGWRCLMAF